MTLKEVLLKEFPNAKIIDENGFIHICPNHFGIVDWGENCPPFEKFPNNVKSCEKCWELEA